MIRTIKADDIAKIAIFDNQSKGYSLSNTKKRTGCTDIINGGYFNMSTRKPLTHLKVDGVVKCSDQYAYWGYAFNTNSKELVMVTDYSLYDNYFCGVCMVRNGQKQTMYYNSDVGGSRGRSAIGVMPNGDIIMYCTKDGSSDRKTPEQLQEYFLNLGVDSAVMLDSGGSSQCDFNGSTITSSRIVSNFICIWENKNQGVTTDEEETENPTNPSTKPSTPTEDEPTLVQVVDKPNWDDENMWTPSYKEPTENIQSGSKGEGAKWVQAMLQKIGFLIIVDGEVGTKSVNAIKTFQKYWSLSADGICGKDTRNALKDCVWGMTASTRPMINVASAEICRTESASQDDKYINWYNAANNTNFATTVAWCAIFVSWCKDRAGLSNISYPNYASCSAGTKVFENLGVLRNPDEYSPKSGDIIMFDANKDGAPEHTGIVFANTGDYIETIEGNSSNAVKHNKYAVNSQSIYRYVEVNY